MSSIIYLDDYETRYFIFYDHQINNKWCFVNIKKGVFKTFNNREKAIKFLGVYGRIDKFINSNKYNFIRLFS